MTGKLFKFEMKSTARFFLPAYAILLGLSVLTRLSSELSDRIKINFAPSALLSVLYVLTCIATVILTVSIVIYRFYKNLTGDEAYLMFTLPLSIHQHILIKLAVSMLWTVAGLAAGLLSLAVNLADSETPNDIKQLFDYALSILKSQYGANAVGYTIWLLIIGVLACAAYYLMFYAAVSLGQCSRTHRVITSIAAYFGLYVANQILLSGAMLVVRMTNPRIIETITDSIQGMNILLILLTVILVAEAAAYYFITHAMMKKHLNLE